MIQKYLTEIFQKYKTGDASERTYYPVLESLCKEFSQSQSKTTSVIIEPRKTKIGIPDFKLKTDRGLLIGYIEAKDLGVELDKVDQKQIEKYLSEYPKLILTNFIEFRLYENKKIVDTTQITEPVTLKLKIPVIKNEARLVGLLEKFFSTVIPEVYTSKRLAQLLAHKTQVLKNLLVEEINLEDKEVTSTEELLEVFRKTLLHTITPEEFADMYAQTVTYGLFVARLNSGDKLFNRTAAFDFIPKTIPLLRRLFHIISGQDLPQHIAWHVDEIAEILANTKIEKIKEEFFAKGKGRDPIIHFYETFLAEYDPKEREKRGVYYTPEPVVSYIVKSINALLKEKFGKKDGFADSSVLVLDPAAGTLTFPAKAIAVAKDEFSKSYGEGGWRSLVKDHILKNFYAFELLMAPYAVGHLKIGLLLEELGYKLTEDARFKLFLTNTLEMEKVKPLSMFLAPEISKESEEAYEVKEKTPILIIFGNPPYSGISENKGEWILKQIEKYKQIEGKLLGERNPKWIQDDYVKFFRFAQWKIEQSGSGILGFITNHAWLDNPTFRGMRYSLLKTFDEIYIINLHGSSLKRERTPGGGEDENVFDIQPGVAITICVQNKDIKAKKIYYADLWGLREEKYDWLEKHEVENTEFQEISSVEPYYFLVPKEEKGWDLYKSFWKITDIFPVNSVGIVTARDHFVIDFEEQPLEARIRIFRNSNEDDNFIKTAYNLEDKPTFRWYVKVARQKLKETKDWENYFTKILYRPFDERWIYYHPTLIERTRKNVMRHMWKPNLALLAKRQQKQEFSYAFVSDKIAESCVFESTYANNSVFPLYLYEKRFTQQILVAEQEKLDIEGIQHTLRFKSEKEPNIDPKLLDLLNNAFDKEVTPEEFFYYIYAVLYSDNYRQKYQEFLKIDFPKIPFTRNYKVFQRLAEFGKHLVDLHLLKSPELDNPVAKFYGSDSNNVEKIEYILVSKPKVQTGISLNFGKFKKTGIIKINDNQFFGGIDPEVWNYHIGGYQVLNKWLKDRKGRTLSSEDIKHYCRIVTALAKTIRVQKRIDDLYSRVEKDLISL